MPAHLSGPSHASFQGNGLDVPPPPPAGAPTRSAGLMMASRPGSNLGASPQIIAMEGLQMMENGAMLLGRILPGLMPMVGDLISRLKATVPRSLAELTASSSSLPTATPTAGLPPPGS